MLIVLGGQVPASSLDVPAQKIQKIREGGLGALRCSTKSAYRFVERLDLDGGGGTYPTKVAEVCLGV
jgi:hypothetical protein